LALLRQCLANLAPGGALVVDVAGKEIILRDIEPVHLTEYEDGRILVERPMLSAGMDRYENEWILIDGSQAHRASWHHNLYSARELTALFEQAGFVDIAVVGSLEGDPYDLEADRLIVVGHRPGD
ncbi:MAG: SAM-dependent methyltransferase, partial [Pseudomonadota bacterium]